MAMPDSTEPQLPEATRDLEQAKADLDRHGYCLIAEALPPAELATARRRLQEQAAAEVERGLAFRDGGKGQNLTDPRGRLRPDAFTATTAPTEDGFETRVTSIEATGAETMLFVEKDGRPITVMTKERIAAAHGDTVWLTADLTHAHYFGADGTRIEAGN